jgi:hypothetical protein
MSVIELVIPYSSDRAFDMVARRRRQDIADAAEPLMAMLRNNAELLRELGYAKRGWELETAAQGLLDAVAGLNRWSDEDR